MKRRKLFLLAIFSSFLLFVLSFIFIKYLLIEEEARSVLLHLIKEYTTRVRSAIKQN
jgi:hypothetical protein